MTVYVCYSDLGAYEGCSAPLAVCKTKTKAEAWVGRQDPYTGATYREMEIEKEYKQL